MSSSDASTGSTGTNLREWTDATLRVLNEGLYEREDVVAKALLSVLSGQSVFLYGPPGTAKSLIARRISCIFKDSRYFEYLMQRFSTPEDVFGPVSISELKKDNYIRKTQNYLPEADIAFLDEIWKSSPAILNTLLTIINERKFKNGSKVEDVPLKAVIAASNEFPVQNSGLDALYDRFIVRIPVDPLSGRSNFERMISGGPVQDVVKVPEPLSTSDWERVIEASGRILIDESVFPIINTIRESVADYLSTDNPVPIYISDRRWQKAFSVLKTAALLCGRERVLPIDTLILKSCLWSTNDNRPILDRIVDEAVCSLNDSLRAEEVAWWEKFSQLDLEVRDVFKRIPRTVRPPVVINNIACIDMQINLGTGTKTINVPYGPKTMGALYSAWDNAGNVYQFQVTETNGNNASIRFVSNPTVTAVVPMAVGESSGVPESTRSTYRRAVMGLESELTGIIDRMQGCIDGMRGTSDTPFVSEDEKERLFSRMEDDLHALKNRVPAVKGLLGFIDEYD